MWRIGWCAKLSCRKCTGEGSSPQFRITWICIEIISCHSRDIEHWNSTKECSISVLTRVDCFVPTPDLGTPPERAVSLKAVINRLGHTEFSTQSQVGASVFSLPLIDNKICPWYPCLNSAIIRSSSTAKAERLKLIRILVRSCHISVLPLESQVKWKVNWIIS